MEHFTSTCEGHIETATTATCRMVPSVSQNCNQYAAARPAMTRAVAMSLRGTVREGAADDKAVLSALVNVLKGALQIKM